ncbi:MAG: efflux RND transporter periplasmic adaptor subunit [Rhodothermales bacterium]
MNTTKKITVITASAALLIIVTIGLTVLVLYENTGPEGAAGTEAAEGSVGHAATGAAPQQAGAGGLAAADRDGDGVVYQDGMHPWIVRDEPGQCPICGMDLIPVQVDQLDDGTVRIDPVTLQNIGVRTAPVTVESLQRSLRTTGRFEMDEQGAHTVSLKVDGWVEVLHADFDGAIVTKGEPLLDLYSPDLVATQEEVLLALRNLERLEGTPAADDARRLLRAARRRLAYWDLTEEQIREIETTREPKRTIRYFAPASGEVMDKQVTEGQHVRAGASLMRIIDIDTIWLMVDVYEQDVGWVRAGTEATVELPYDPGATFRGRVDHVYHMLDTDTRTARARITLQGGHHAPLKPGMYATVRLEGGRMPATPVVPDEAVIRTGDREVVILALGEGRFMPADVVTGFEASGRTQILSGLQGNERVVTSAQFLIDSEARLRSAVGAMAGHDHGEMNSSDAPMNVESSDVNDSEVE